LNVFYIYGWVTSSCNASQIATFSDFLKVRFSASLTLSFAMSPLMKWPSS